MIKKTKLKNHKTKITFILPGEHTYGRVFLVGDFNSWNGSAHRFIKRSNNTYSVSVVIDSGSRHVFRYLSESGEWINDEAADEYCKNEHGTDNCVVTG